MGKYLGRNPFEKTKKSSSKPRPDFTQQNTTPLEWLFIQLPAKTFMLALKTGILLKTGLECAGVCKKNLKEPSN